jgi:hypothetical protein
MIRLLLVDYGEVTAPRSPRTRSPTWPPSPTSRYDLLHEVARARWRARAEQEIRHLG